MNDTWCKSNHWYCNCHVDSLACDKKRLKVWKGCEVGMRLIDADELMEHVGRDRLDSRELIMDMVKNAPTVKPASYNRTAKLYGFDNVEDFAQFLISRGRKDKLIVSVELSENSCKMSIEPLENRVYLCPHYGETKEKR